MTEPPVHNCFKKLCKTLSLTSLPQFDNKKLGFTDLVFELYVLKPELKGVFVILFYCYGNVICYEAHMFEHGLLVGVVSVSVFCRLAFYVVR